RRSEAPRLGEQIVKIAALMTDVENHLSYELSWSQARFSQPRPGPLTLYLEPEIQLLLANIHGNLRIQTINRRHMPGIPDALALSIALRLWAGLVDSAKTV